MVPKGFVIVRVVSSQESEGRLRPSFDDNGLQTLRRKKIWSRNSRGKLGLSRFPHERVNGLELDNVQAMEEPRPTADPL
ncbi:unnamed protein product, partial [Brassica rapa]